MDDLISRSFRFDGSRSFSFDRNTFTRSNTSRLASEIGSARFATYEKLSDSMRLVDDVNTRALGTRNGVWRFVTKVFSLKKATGDSSDPRRSSWRPDPNSRWPVQGW